MARSRRLSPKKLRENSVQAKNEKRKGFQMGFFTLEENPVYRSYVGIGIRPLYIFYLMNPKIYTHTYMYIYVYANKYTPSLD